MEDQIFEACYQRYLQGGKGFWNELASQYGYESGEKLRIVFKAERKRRGIPAKGIGLGKTTYKTRGDKLDPFQYVNKQEITESNSSGESSIVFNFPEEDAEVLKKIFMERAKSPRRLVEMHGFDPELWEIKWAKSNGWNMPSGGGNVIVCYQSKISLQPKGIKGITTEDIDRYFETIYHKAPRPKSHLKKNFKSDGYILEVNLADVHFGKVSIDGVESTYDTLLFAVENLIQKIEKYPMSKIVVTGLGDIFHFDTKRRTTSAGTPVTTSGKTPQQNFDEALDAFVEIIEQFLNLAPVEYIHVAGNHDNLTSYYFAKALELYFKKYKDVKVDTGHSQRKFRLFGNSLVGWIHGDVNKNRMLSNFLQIEARELWGKAKYAEIHSGHIHHQQTVETGGLIWRSLPTISEPDEWHDENLFVGNQGAICSFLWTQDRGLSQIIFSPVYWEG